MEMAESAGEPYEMNRYYPDPAEPDKDIPKIIQFMLQLQVPTYAHVDANRTAMPLLQHTTHSIDIFNLGRN